MKKENRFYDAIEKETNKTTTENGAGSFSSTLNKNLDFFAQASAKRGSDTVFKELFEPAVFENPELALKNLFYLRDVRGGNGERQIFRDCLEGFFRNIKKYKLGKITNSRVKNFLKLIPEYGRWDDLIELNTYSKTFENIKCSIIKDQFIADMKNALADKPVSLLAKWFPVYNNVKNSERKGWAKKLCYKIFRGDFKKAREIVGSLRSYIDIVEKRMSTNDWLNIDYSKVPSRAGLLYRDTFGIHDPKGYNQFLNRVLEGTEKINAGTLAPYDIVREYRKEYFKNNDCCINDTLEEMWKALPDDVNTQNAICVVDVSDSMGWTSGRGNNIPKPIDVAISLGIYFSEKNPTEVFRNKFLTFSQRPSFVSFDENMSLFDRIERTEQADWGANTNITRVFELILETALKHNLKNSDMPKTIFIISDMQFDDCCNFGSETAYDAIRNKYKNSGYDLPTICFWNVAARVGNIPVLNNEKNVTLVSGFSQNNFRFVMEGKTPVELMNEVLGSDRYKNVKL